MADLRFLASHLEEDLQSLSLGTGIPRKTLERARAAWSLVGAAGLQALGPLRATPELEAFHHRQIELWLRREVPDLAVEIRSARNRHTIMVDGRDSFQLRFVPDACRWILFERRERSWWPGATGRPCLALTDWLGQIRRRLTLGAKSR